MAHADQQYVVRIAVVAPELHRPAVGHRYHVRFPGHDFIDVEAQEAVLETLGQRTQRAVVERHVAVTGDPQARVALHARNRQVLPEQLQHPLASAVVRRAQAQFRDLPQAQGKRQAGLRLRRIPREPPPAAASRDPPGSPPRAGAGAWPASRPPRLPPPRPGKPGGNARCQAARQRRKPRRPCVRPRRTARRPARKPRPRPPPPAPARPAAAARPIASRHPRRRAGRVRSRCPQSFRFQLFRCTRRAISRSLAVSMSKASSSCAGSGRYGSSAWYTYIGRSTTMSGRRIAIPVHS